MSAPPSTPTPDNTICVSREDWDKCIRHGTWRVAIGIMFGAVGSTFLISEIPMMVGAGLGIGWAVKHCKNILKGPETKPAGTAKMSEVDELCGCCHSDFEALDKEEFKETPVPPSPTPFKQPPPPRTEEKICTCDIGPGWSPPEPDPTTHPENCSCLR